MLLLFDLTDWGWFLVAIDHTPSLVLASMEPSSTMADKEPPILTLWHGSDRIWRTLALFLLGLLALLLGLMANRYRAHQKMLLNLNRQVLMAWELRAPISRSSTSYPLSKASGDRQRAADSKQDDSKQDDPDAPSPVGESPTPDREGSRQNPSDHGLDPARYRRLQVLYAKIIHVIEAESLALSPDINLESLARRVSSNQKYVSQAISEHGQTNFYELINEYRVQQARRLLSDVKKEAPPGDVLATECGFGSRSSFYEVFKKKTGMTPKVFRKEALLSMQRCEEKPN